MALRASQGLTLVAAVLDADAVPIGRSGATGAFALVLGAEGPGLAAGTQRAVRRAGDHPHGRRAPTR